jgi:hypothetical protein
MPTLIYFIGAKDPVRLDEDYGVVNAKLKTNPQAEFKRAGNRLTIYQAGIAYTQEVQEGAPFVA